jgi:hypothetical protein
VDDQAILRAGLDRRDHAPVAAVDPLDPTADQVDQQHVVGLELEIAAVDRDRLTAQRVGLVAIGDAGEAHEVGAAHRASRLDRQLAPADEDDAGALERVRVRVVQRDADLAAHPVGARDHADVDAGGLRSISVLISVPISVSIRSRIRWRRSPHRDRPVTRGSRPECACRCAARPR